MMHPTFTTTSVLDGSEKNWSVAGLFRALFVTRREIKRISAQARRERLSRGYRRVPQRVWDRRSALFIER